MSGFLDRLRRRKLVQWAVAYVAAAFALLQGVDIIAAKFAWPDSVERVLIIALCVGFFVALLLAWYHGEQGRQRVTGAELLLIALVLAVGGGFLWQFTRAPHTTRTSAGRSAVEPSNQRPAATASEQAATQAKPLLQSIPAKSIAVLPFENLSEDKGNKYFADGMQDMILTKLAAIGDLKVISRTSTEKYASHPDDLKTIAQQLGVASILEGSVQRSGNSVLINVQLIDANSDAHLWAEAYPRTLENIFGVEGEVAQKVADALKAKLTAAESASVASVPTQNPAAYDAFLRGEYQAAQGSRSWQASNFRAADTEFRRAIDLDPRFALAYAARAYTELGRHWFVSALSDKEMAAVKASIDRALELAPDLPEAHLALGYYYYWGFRRYDDATREFERVLKLSPNNAEAVGGLGFVARRTGRVDQAAAYFEQALKLSPRDILLNSALGETDSMLRRYTDGDRLLQRALSIAPTDANSLDLLLQTRLFGFGDVAGARKGYRPLPGWRISGQMRWAGDVLYLINPRAYANFFDRRFADALHDWDGAPTDTEEERRTGQVARIVIRMVAGEGASTRPECAQLEPVVKADLAKQPESLGAMQRLAWVEVCLGHDDKAIAAARKAVDLLPVSKDGYFGAYELTGLAQIAAHAGSPDEALKAIRQLLDLQVGSVMSVKRLELDPIWDPLRKDPRFQKLIADGQAAQAKVPAQ